MSTGHKPQTMQVALNLSELGIPGRLALLALIFKFAPTSAQYGSNAAFKAAVDKATGHLPTLTTAENNSEAAKKAATIALVARDTEIAATDADINVARALAATVCKTAADLQANGFNRKVRNAPVPLTAPEAIIAQGGKKVKASISLHAQKIAGLYKYICALSLDPITPTSFTILAGTAAKRTITGLESGKGYWVRFCTERGQTRSDWSAPVYVVAS